MNLSESIFSPSSLLEEVTEVSSNEIRLVTRFKYPDGEKPIVIFVTQDEEGPILTDQAETVSWCFLTFPSRKLDDEILTNLLEKNKVSVNEKLGELFTPLKWDESTTLWDLEESLISMIQVCLSLSVAVQK